MVFNFVLAGEVEKVGDLITAKIIIELIVSQNTGIFQQN